MKTDLKKDNRIDILGVQIDGLTPSQSIDMMADYIKADHHKSMTVVKPYVEFMTRAHHDEKIRQILNQANLCLPDGISLQWAASFLYGQPSYRPTLFSYIKSLVVLIQRPTWRNQIIPERGAGVDATKKLLARAEREGWRVGIVGGKQENVADRKTAITNIFPELELIQIWPGYFNDSEEKKIVEQIKSSRLDILFVARGFPLQEYFIDSYQKSGLAKILIGEGGSFDYDQLGGKLKRAPQAWRKIGIEWFWRLILQPKRIGRMLSIPHFTWLVYCQAKSKK